MNRRKFISGLGAVALLGPPKARGQARNAGLNESAAGQPVNLARYGELKSWISPEAYPLLRDRAIVDRNPGTALSLANAPWKDSQFDIGVEWPEFRTVGKVIVHFVRGRTPRAGEQFLEYWDGLTALQGTWKAFEAGHTNGTHLDADGPLWTYTFASRRTAKVRLRFQGPQQAEIEEFEIQGPSKWKAGEVRIEWGGHERAPVEGSLEAYNAEILAVQPFGAARSNGAHAWNSSGGNSGGVVAKVLYTWGMDVDRSILTVRSGARGFSFLPGETIEGEPIEVADFGVYIRNNAVSLDRSEFRARYAGRSRVIDAVARHPEQTIEGAYANIHARRVTLSFAGVDANNQKFGVAPDGHFVIGNGDPLAGDPIVPSFAIYFDTAEQPVLFQPPPPPLDAFAGAQNTGEWATPKDQELEEGWLPIITTRWSQNDLGFQRTDFAALHHGPEPLDESKLIGNEPAVLISRLVIRNVSPFPKLATYFIRPWQPAGGVRFTYGPIPAGVRESWTTALRDNCVTALHGTEESAVCFVDTHGRGHLALAPSVNAVRYQVQVQPGEEHVIHTVVPGWLPPASEITSLRNVAYDRLHAAAGQYWKARLAEGMQIEVPERRLQNIANATLQHFLLVMTKNGHKGEHYPNVAMLYYGSIGSESSPIIQSLDMRGQHRRAEHCLEAFLSTQNEFMPDGDYRSKDGGFYRFWPIYTIDQGGVLWALAEHYLYTRDKDWLGRVAPKILAGCEFLLRERKRTQTLNPDGSKPLSYGLAPAGCVADPRDWQYSFMLNSWFYLGLKKAAQALADIDAASAQHVAAEAQDYRDRIVAALRESIALSPVTRLRDGTSVPTVPPYLGLRGLSSDVKDSVDPDRRHGYAYDLTIGPFHVMNSEVLSADDPVITWMLNYFEDRFFLFTPLPSRVDLERIATDWFDLGGFEKLQPYYVHYQQAYLLRDQIPNFVRGFYNTLASISDPQTLTFQEELDFGGGQPHKTHEEGWFFHQLRQMLVLENGNDLLLARGTPRRWLEHGQQIAIERAPSYFGELSYRIRSAVQEGRIEATVQPPGRNPPASIHLRFRHPQQARIRSVSVNGSAWNDFDAGKEWIKLPAGTAKLEVAARY